MKSRLVRSRAHNVFTSGRVQTSSIATACPCKTHVGQGKGQSTPIQGSYPKPYYDSQYRILPHKLHQERCLSKPPPWSRHRRFVEFQTCQTADIILSETGRHCDQSEKKIPLNRLRDAQNTHLFPLPCHSRLPATESAACFLRSPCTWQLSETDELWKAQPIRSQGEL